MSQTPEGAEIIIDRAIKNLEKDYTVKKSMLVELISNEKEQSDMIEDLEKRERFNKKGKQAMSDGNVGIAENYAMNLKNTRERLEKCNQNVSSLIENKKDLESIVEISQQKLLSLKDEGNTVFKQMRIDDKIIETYKKMDILVSKDSAEEMLEDVRENAKQLKYKRQGLKKAHDNDIMTKINSYELDIDVSDVMSEFTD